MEEASGRGQLDEVAELNNRFHGASWPPRATSGWSGCCRAWSWCRWSWRTFHRYSPDALARSHAHHRELLAALAAGDPEWAAR